MTASGKARWIRLAFFGAPTLCLAIGIFMIVDTIRFLGASESAEAEVISVEVRRSGKGTYIEGDKSAAISANRDEGQVVYDESYTPTLRFEHAGRSVEAPTHISSDSYDYEIGTRVGIRYDPQDLSTVRIDGIWSLWAFPVILTLLGSGLLVVVILGRDQIDRQLRGR